MSSILKLKPVDILISREINLLSRNLRIHKNINKNKQPAHQTKSLKNYISTLLDNIDKTATTGEKRTKVIKSSLVRELENTTADDAMRRKRSEKPVVVLRGKDQIY